MSRYYRARGCRNCRCVTDWFYLCRDCWRLAIIMPIATLALQWIARKFFG